MHSYSIYTGISHVNQLTKLHPALMLKIQEELDHLAREFGGRPADPELYVFPPSLAETARKAAEAASAMYRFLMESHEELLGVTVFIAGSAEDSLEKTVQLEPLLLKVPEDDGLWVSDEVLDDFTPYFEGSFLDGLFRVSGMKEAGLSLKNGCPGC